MEKLKINVLVILVFLTISCSGQRTVVQLTDMKILNEKYEVDTFHRKFGYSDKVVDLQTKDEFGFDSYELWYNKSHIIITDGYISDIWVKDKSIALFGVTINDHKSKVEKLFSINSDNVHLFGNPEGTIGFEFENQILTQITLSISIY